jgi:ribonuclease E
MPESDAHASAEAMHGHPESMLKKLWGMLFAPPGDDDVAGTSRGALAETKTQDAAAADTDMETPKQRRQRSPRRPAERQERSARGSDTATAGQGDAAEDNSDAPRRAQGGARDGDSAERQRGSRRSGRGGRSRRGGQRDQAQTGGGAPQGTTPGDAAPAQDATAERPTEPGQRGKGQLVARAETLPMTVDQQGGRRGAARGRAERAGDASTQPAGSESAAEQPADAVDTASVPADGEGTSADAQGSSRGRSSRRRRGGRRRRSNASGDAATESGDQSGPQSETETQTGSKARDAGEAALSGADAAGRGERAGQPADSAGADVSTKSGEQPRARSVTPSAGPPAPAPIARAADVGPGQATANDPGAQERPAATSRPIADTAAQPSAPPPADRAQTARDADSSGATREPRPGSADAGPAIAGVGNSSGSDGGDGPSRKPNGGELPAGDPGAPVTAQALPRQPAVPAADPPAGAAGQAAAEERSGSG